MPFVSPMLFGSSVEKFDAVIEFGSADSTGGQDRPIYNSPVTVISDPNGYLGTPNNTDSTVKWVPFATFGTYRFTLIQNTAFDSKETSEAVRFGEVTVNTATTTVDTFNNIFTIWTDTEQSPNPVTRTIVNDLGEDGLALQFPTGESYSMSGNLQIGIEKL